MKNRTDNPNIHVTREIFRSENIVLHETSDPKVYQILSIEDGELVRVRKESIDKVLRKYFASIE